MEGKGKESCINCYCISTIICSFFKNLFKKKEYKGKDMSELFNEPVERGDNVIKL